MMGFVHIMIILTGAVIITCLLSCTKKSERYRNANRHDQFIGTYRVINANPQFEFTIENTDSTDVNGNPYIKVRNFANLFDMKYRIAWNYKPANTIEFPGYFPITDKFGNRWSFDVYGNPNVPDNCLLHEDTLRVYFRIQNAPWYVDDDTIGIDKFYLQTAVKIK